MTKEAIGEIFADYKKGISNRMYGSSTKFCKRTIVRGLKVPTGRVEKERPAIVISDSSEMNLDLLTNHLSVVPILTKPCNDMSIPMIIDYFGDNRNKVSFVDPVTQAEVLYWSDISKQITRVQTCPDVVFDLIITVRNYLNNGQYDAAAQVVKEYRLKFMREHGILSIGYIITADCMKYLDADGTERYEAPNTTGWVVLWLQDANVEEVTEEEFDEGLVFTSEDSEPAVTEMQQALQGITIEEPVVEEVITEEETAEKKKKQKSSVKSPKTFRKKKSTKKSAPRKWFVAELSNEELVDFMAGIETAENPATALHKLFPRENLTATGFKNRYEAVCRELTARGYSDLIIPWEFSDPKWKNHWKHLETIAKE